MKRYRYNKIKEIVQSKAIETQEELAAALLEEGIEVTQATVSRDIKELMLIKIPTGDGHYRYALSPEENVVLSRSRINRLFQDSLIKVDHSLNQVVTKPHQTIDAINEGLHKLSKSGVITIVAYPGTTEGFEEMQSLKSYLSDLDQKIYNVCHWHPMNQIHNPPELFILQKR